MLMKDPMLRYALRSFHPFSPGGVCHERMYIEMYNWPAFSRGGCGCKRTMPETKTVNALIPDCDSDFGPR